ncbi:MAG TPA: hypothetical protein VLA37_07100, partial [Sphingomonadaceae bacterium]|nr:hypothetical protein [Sphingomonadaceae bacterium]
MKRIAIAATALLLANPAIAAHHEEAAPEAEAKPKVEIVSVGEDGKPDVVRIDGYETKVCKGDVKDA